MELITMLNQMGIEDLKSMYYTLEKRCEMLEERCSKLENKLDAAVTPEETEEMLKEAEVERAIKLLELLKKSKLIKRQ